MKDTLAEEAKAIVALAFRNGPVEDLHAGRSCHVCRGDESYSHITNEEMKTITRNAVNMVYKLLLLRQDDPREYAQQIKFGNQYTDRWDEPEL